MFPSPMPASRPTPLTPEPSVTSRPAALVQGLSDLHRTPVGPWRKRVSVFPEVVPHSTFRSPSSQLPGNEWLVIGHYGQAQRRLDCPCFFFFCRRNPRFLEASAKNNWLISAGQDVAENRQVLIGHGLDTYTGSSSAGSTSKHHRQAVSISRMGKPPPRRHHKYRVWHSEETPLPTWVSGEMPKPKPLLPSEPRQQGPPDKKFKKLP